MDSDPHQNALGEEKRINRYRSIIEAVRDGVFVINSDGTITYVNDAICSLTEQERSDLLDETFETLVDSELIDSGQYDRFVTSVTELSDGDSEKQNLIFEIGHEERRVLDVRLSKHNGNDDTENIVGVVRDITEREQRIQAAEQKQQVLAQLYEISAKTSLSFEEKTERILGIGCEYLDLPFGFLTRVDSGLQQMVHTVGDHELIQPHESAPLEKSYCRKTIESDGLVGMQDAQSELGADDPAYELFELGCYIGTKVLVGQDLYGTFCFAAPHNRDREFTSGEREVIKLLGQWAGYELERQQFEERLHGLHEISQQLLQAETTEAVATTSIQMSAELFDLPVTAFWEYDSASDLLRPVAETETAEEIIGEAPSLKRGEALVWESFESGEIRNYEDVANRSGVYNPDTKLRSEIHVPCGDHGIITSAAMEPRAFDEIDIESLQLLGALVTEAMTAVKREERLVERGEVLQRQNERLDEFAHLVAHDLRNPLAGAVGSLEIARETNEDRFFDRVEQSLKRMDELIEELLNIARGDRQAVTVQRHELRNIVEEAWTFIDTPDATLSLQDDLGEIQADETRLLQLFSNLFRNSIEHGGKDVTVKVGRLSERSGFFVADSGPGLPDETRADIQELGQVSSPSGTGIGIMSVIDIVEAHDWDLAVPDVERGARFEILTNE